jgi:ribosomal 50S subunit-recycling heat shock protein
MRLDKYLKVTRLVKRRTVANEACDMGRVTVNGRVARASLEIKENDIIELSLGQRTLRVKVLNVPEHATKESAGENYTIID